MTGCAGYGGHYSRCPGCDDCVCEALLSAENAATAGDALDCAYGEFYDPDFDADPFAEPEPYGGWNRAHRGQQ